jgi:histidine triad (HIT) family protein
MSDCIFCKIANGEVSSSKVFEDTRCVAFNDLHPQAPVHILVVPKEHVSSLAEASEDHEGLLGHLLLKAAGIARDKGFAEAGYRVVINTNHDGGQTVFHLHVHLLAGREFVFPPG